MKYINNKKGSILINVIIVISIVTILSTMLMSITFANLNMKMVDQSNKQTLYHTETGLDQLELIANSMLNEAYDYAHSKTIDSIQLQVLDSNNYINTTFLTNGTVDFDKLNNFIISQFNSYYKNYLDEFLSDTSYSLVDYLEDSNNIQSLNNQTTKSIITVLEDEIVPFNDNVDNNMQIPVNVKYYDTSIEMQKSIDTIIEITPPKYTLPLYVKETTTDSGSVSIDYAVICKNLSSNSSDLTVNGNLYSEDLSLNAHSLTVNGNVYTQYINTSASTDININGSLYAFSESRNPTIKLNAGSLTVNGNIFSEGDIELVSSKINQSNGNIAADSITLQSSPMILTNTNIIVRDTLHIYQSSSFNLTGSYYGYGDESNGYNSYINIPGDNPYFKMNNGEIYIDGETNGYSITLNQNTINNNSFSNYDITSDVFYTKGQYYQNGTLTSPTTPSEVALQQKQNLINTMYEELKNSQPSTDDFLNLDITSEEEAAIQAEIQEVFGSDGFLEIDGKNYFVLLNTSDNGVTVTYQPGTGNKIQGNQIWHTGEIHGLILSKGGVSFLQNVDFHGHAYSEGSVTFNSQTQNVYYDDNVLDVILELCPTLASVLFSDSNNNNNGGCGCPSTNPTPSEKNYILVIDSSIDIITDDLFYFSNWHLD